MRWLLFSIALLLTGCPSRVPTAPKIAEGTAHADTAMAAIDPPKVSFKNVTRDIGVNFIHTHGGYGQKLMPETMGPGVVIFDYNGDGHQDVLFVNSCRWPHYKDKYASPASSQRLALYENDGKGNLKDVTEAVGLADLVCYGMGAAAGDIDNDGFPELVITALNRAYLFHNQGGRGFKDITESAGLKCPGWSTSAAFLDYDRDGKLDLFLCHYVKWTVETDLVCKLDGKNKSYCQPDKYEGEHCQLFHNLGGLKFEDVSAKAGLHINDVTNVRSASKALGVAVHDFNDDGWPDIAVANDTTPNFLFENQKNGTFKNVAGPKGVEQLNANSAARGAMGIHWGYYRDGNTLGLAIANFANEPNSLLRYSQKSATFTDCAMADGVHGPSLLPLKFGLFFFDYDLDGRLDLFTSNGHIEPDIEKVQARVKYAQPAQLFWNAGARKEGCYREVEPKHAGPDLFEPRVGRGTAFGDLDGDGDLDVTLANNNQAATILRNECPTNSKSIRLKVIGKTCNRDAYGARVKLWVNGTMQQSELNSGGSYLSQNESVLTFGLGEHGKAEKIEIRWPTKELKTTELKDLEAGLLYVVDENGGVIEKRPFRR